MINKFPKSGLVHENISIDIRSNIHKFRFHINVTLCRIKRLQCEPNYVLTPSVHATTFLIVLSIATKHTARGMIMISCRKSG